MRLETNELIKINGGATLSGSLISSLIRGINSILDLGRSLGTAIRRIFSKKVCSL